MKTTKRDHGLILWAAQEGSLYLEGLPPSSVDGCVPERRAT
jgi:hypothetical protein